VVKERTEGAEYKGGKERRKTAKRVGMVKEIGRERRRKGKVGVAKR